MKNGRTRARAGPRRKGSKKLFGRSQPVGQMFKQTSNYLNSISDLQDGPGPELSVSFFHRLTRAPPLSSSPPPSFFGPLARSFQGSEDVVKPRKTHGTCISFAARVELRSPFYPAAFDRNPSTNYWACAVWGLRTICGASRRRREFGYTDIRSHDFQEIVSYCDNHETLNTRPNTNYPKTCPTGPSFIHP